jgi:zinc and cadmium transporter
MQVRAATEQVIEMTTTLSVFCLLIVTVSVLGGVLPLATVLTHTRLQVYLSFSAGTMLGAAFFHMMPEAVRVGSAATIPWAAVGLLSLFFLERFFSFHHHESPVNAPKSGDECGGGGHTHDVPTVPHAPSHAGAVAGRPVRSKAQNTLPWGSAAIGLAVHSLVGGVALSSSVAADFEVRAGLGSAGLGVFLATLVHKPADALTITSLMLRAGSSRSSAMLVNLGFGLMIPAGVAVFALGLGGMSDDAIKSWTAGALAFSAGTFLCIALSDLLPELQFHSHDRLKLSVALLAGLGLMALAAAVEPAAPPVDLPKRQIEAIPPAR